MFKKVLIANRGEIAVRIIRACREMDIKTAIIHSDVDGDSLAVSLADEAINLKDYRCYLDIEAIIKAAEECGADAVHPGYGFLAENAAFPQACLAAGIDFIGPKSEIMALMGDKARARELAVSAGLPVVPGSPGPVGSLAEAEQYAERLGYPVLLKAAAGGGGRGMRIVHSPQELPDGLEQARAEALSAFNNGTMLLEKYLEAPRHVEIQILADSYGKVVYLPERDCSIQRRHQKLIEESPSPAVTPDLRREIGEAAARLAERVGYHTVGTVEFLMDRQGNYFFMEMNTRIQVEHPVTELVTGIDLIKEQIRLAAGERLSINQADVRPLGWAMECRINAEDPFNGFRPSPGLITRFEVPGGPGVRVEAGVYQGWTVPAVYDSLLAKLLVWGKDREEVCRRMLRALEEFKVEGVPTTVPFHSAALSHEVFRYGEVSTNFIELNMQDFTNFAAAAREETVVLQTSEEIVAAIAGAVAVLGRAENKHYRVTNIQPQASAWKLINRKNAVLSPGL